jgi:hypothetical protein
MIRARSVWGLAGPRRVYDSGTDGYGLTSDDNTLLATQGVFVP